MDYLISGVPFDDLDLDHFNVIGDNEAFQFYKQFFLYFRLLVSVRGQCHFYMLMKFFTGMKYIALFMYIQKDSC